MSDILDSASRADMARILAHLVEESVAIGRAYGFSYPPEYTVGLKVIEQGSKIHLRLRVDDTNHTIVTNLDRLVEDLLNGAGALVLRWAAEHPAFVPSREQARAVAGQMDSAEWKARVTKEVREAVKLARYRREP